MIFKTIVVDPPWPMVRSFGGSQWARGERERPVLDYPTLTIDQIKDMDIDRISDSSSCLYLWTTQHFLREAFIVLGTWKFDPVCTLVWGKDKGGFVGGAWFSNTEFLIYSKRVDSRIKEKMNSQWFYFKRGKHSEKPEEFQDMIEKVNYGPYLELFARRKRQGWACWGNEIESDITFSVGG